MLIFSVSFYFMVFLFSFFFPSNLCLKIIIVLDIKIQTLELNSLGSESQFHSLCDFDQVT